MLNQVLLRESFLELHTGYDEDGSTYRVFEDLSNLIGISPIWEGGVNGIMQLFILSQLDQILSKRIFN